MIVAIKKVAAYLLFIIISFNVIHLSAPVPSDQIMYMLLIIHRLFQIGFVDQSTARTVNDTDAAFHFGEGVFV